MEAGYYRYKISDLTEGTYEFPWYIDGEYVGTSKVIIKPFCDNYKYLKFLDSNGFYRFYPFNDRWQQQDKSRLIGKSNNIITSLKDAKTNATNIGYTVQRSITLTADNVSEEELDVFSDIYISPRVYLKGEGKEDWVLVDLKGSGIGKRTQNNFGKISLTINLPEHYAITSI